MMEVKALRAVAAFYRNRLALRNGCGCQAHDPSCLSDPLKSAASTRAACPLPTSLLGSRCAILMPLLATHRVQSDVHGRETMTCDPEVRVFGRRLQAAFRPSDIKPPVMLRLSKHGFPSACGTSFDKQNEESESIRTGPGRTMEVANGLHHRASGRPQR